MHRRYEDFLQWDTTVFISPEHGVSNFEVAFTELTHVHTETWATT